MALLKLLVVCGAPVAASAQKMWKWLRFIVTVIVHGRTGAGERERDVEMSKLNNNNNIMHVVHGSSSSGRRRGRQ